MFGREQDSLSGQSAVLGWQFCVLPSRQFKLYIGCGCGAENQCSNPVGFESRAPTD